MSTYTSDPGTRLGGRYRLEDRLADASGWSAWKAIDEILARPVSVITFVAGFPRLEQVMTAARAASRLTDTRLTQVFDVEDSWDHGYIVLEWPVGDTLGDLLSDDSIEPQSAARIVAEAAAAVSGAHAAGLAHLCLRPDAIRWTPGGGVKVTGLGIDAALSGATADNPQVADTRGLGCLLYAALTGLWPGPDSPELPPAPQADGQPLRPADVRAGLPAALDEVATRALALPGCDRQAVYDSPAELSAALAAVLPPLQVPSAAAAYRGRSFAPAQAPATRWDSGQWDTGRTVAQPGSARSAATTAGGYPAGPGYGSDSGVPRRGAARAVLITFFLLAAAAGVTVGALHLLHKSPAAAASAPPSSASATTPATVTVTPVSAQGFDALNPADTGDENTAQAANVLTGNPAGWSTQEYFNSPYFGHLKAGTGLILDLGKAVKVSSVTVTFGSVPGADVQIKIGDSNARSAANLASMTTVASQDNVSGTVTFTASPQATGRYLVIWFTKLPPMAGAPGKYSAQIYHVSVRASS